MRKSGNIEIRIDSGMSWPHLRRLIATRGGEALVTGRGARARKLVERAIQEYGDSEIIRQHESQDLAGEEDGVYTVVILRPPVTPAS